jgi:translation initiation factor 5B
MTRVTAGRGILMSIMANGFFEFLMIMLFLFCTPDLNIVLALDAPQPFIQIYSLALGKSSSIVMTTIAAISLVMVNSFCFYDNKSGCSDRTSA